MSREDSNKNITLEGVTGVHAILILLSVAMLIIGIYLTNHFFDSHFPTTLGEGSACNINSYFNCDVATFSRFGHIMGVPISFFGALLGFLFLVGSLFPSPNMEKTSKFLATSNAILCLFLMSYSLFFLKGLCPICMLYWFISLAIFLMFLKFGVPSFKPSIKILATYLLPLFVGGFFISNHFNKLKDLQTRNSASLVTQFFSLPNIGDPLEESPFRLASATKVFKDAPIRLSIFSDFQCPACKMLSDVLPSVIKRYEGKINVQYFFYPLDPSCNPNVEHSMHPLACRAAHIAACLPEDFYEIHEEIFKGQDQMSVKWLNELADNHKVSECVGKEDTKNLVTKVIHAGDIFHIGATPTIILNGVKIETVLFPQQFYSIMDAILERSK